MKWHKKIIKWLATGETGVSSMTIAFAALGEPYERPGHPGDPADLRRCMVLLDRVPEAARVLPNLAATSPAWEGLVREWAALAKMLREEIGDDLPSRGWSAPKTYDAMKRAMGERQ